jgi:hypothetical protein
VIRGDINTDKVFGTHTADEDVTVDGVTVTDDVSRCCFPTIRIGELARNPFSRRMRNYSQPQDFPALPKTTSQNPWAHG